MLRFVKVMAWGFVLFSVLGIAEQRRAHSPSPVATTGTEQTSWFARTKPYCNGVEVVTRLRQDPPPGDLESQGYGAACYALAGRIDSARAMIYRLQPNDRYRAAGIVFEVGHPVADMGDDQSAGPIMELVVEFWPNHYMALYHAGASRYQLGQHAPARQSLTEFLRHYLANDGWAANARAMLEALASNKRQLERPLESVH